MSQLHMLLWELVIGVLELTHTAFKNLCSYSIVGSLNISLVELFNQTHQELLQTVTCFFPQRPVYLYITGNTINMYIHVFYV